MEIIFRQARENDFKESENLTREAFWDIYKPGCDEHLVLHRIRTSKCYIGELDILEVEGEKIIGHIICTKARVIDSKNK
jgi:predicted N-acetyltransferase YhbS